jgi:serine/threonine-protein kinase RsbW
MVPELRRELETSMQGKCADIVLDLAEVVYADSSALGLLVWLDHRLRPSGGRLVLAGANRDVTRILELSGLVTVATNIATSASVTAALEGLDLPDEHLDPLWHEQVDVPPEIGSLGAVREQVCEMIRPLGFPDASLFDIKVALGEAMANAVRHGAPNDAEGKVRVDVTSYADRVVLEVMDNGVRFDGAHAETDDVYAPGGRGIMFMQALMDRVEYDSSPLGGTLVRLTKHRPGVT